MPDLFRRLTAVRRFSSGGAGFFEVHSSENPDLLVSVFKYSAFEQVEQRAAGAGAHLAGKDVYHEYSVASG